MVKYTRDEIGCAYVKGLNELRSMLQEYADKNPELRSGLLYSTKSITKFRLVNKEFWLERTYKKLKETADAGFWGVTLSSMCAPDGYYCCPNHEILNYIKEDLEANGFKVVSTYREPLAEIWEGKYQGIEGEHHDNTLIVRWD